MFDPDSSRGGPEAVRRDAAALITVVVHGADGPVADESPSGGWHIYIPFRGPRVGFHDARDLALALASRTPTMDSSPNQNLTGGLIKPPG